MDENKNLAYSTFNATEEYFEKAITVIKPLCDFYDTLCNDNSVIQLFDSIVSNKLTYDMNNRDKVFFLFSNDIINCYELLGHNALNLFSKEGLVISIVEIYATSGVLFSSYSSVGKQSFVDAVKSICELNYKRKNNAAIESSQVQFYIKKILERCNNKDLIVQYFSLLYKFFSVIAKADNTITHEESMWLQRLMSYSQTNQDNKGNDYSIKGNIIEWNIHDREEKHTEKKSEKESKLDQHVQGLKKTKESIQELQRLIYMLQNKDKNQKEKEAESQTINTTNNAIIELQTMIGLSEVKEEISSLTNFVKIQKEREKRGMKAMDLSYHCVFTGNPGTGKTTVARIVAEIYKQLGVLKKGHLVETDRSGLVAEYMGQTAVKTNKIIDTALDGVLFIDEAYSLVQGYENDYGKEAISTLLKRMEDDRDRLIVIIAGYSNEIKDFVDSNPGLQSRFTRYIHFSDYTADELKQIFLLNAQKNQYTLDKEGILRLEQLLKYEVSHKDKNFGNGRFVRNLFEKTILNQATRLADKPNITSEELSKLIADDIPFDCSKVITSAPKKNNSDNENYLTKEEKDVISLKTNQVIFNDIKSKKVNIYTQEIRPETNSLFCELDDEGSVKEIDGILQPRRYNKLSLSTDKESCIFNIKESRIELFEDENGELITYEENGVEYIKAQIVYYLD